jgi:hypothetical protein
MDVVAPPETTMVAAAREGSRRLAVELIGGLFLVFTVGAVVYGGSPLASLGSDPRTTAEDRPRENA